METIESPTSKARQVLKQYYGFDAFRPPQDQIIDKLIAGEDLLVLMPTGGGKSLCYQIPSMLRSGVGVVISPLIALMEDQVSALKHIGVRAAYYNSSLSSSEARAILTDLHRQNLDLLYIAPERLLGGGFLSRLQECPIALFAIDEAHCISQWGHDFRPEYANLGLLKTHFPEVPIIALTATADKQTRADIVQQLAYQPQSFIASFNRPNIHYRVLPKSQPIRQIEEFLQAQGQQAGIIYCTTRDTVERVALQLQNRGFRARAYHAGLDFNERREVQQQFRFDQIDIVVATIAFGMGIDKSNVRFVIHHDLPKSIESYYQETGRAGRDGSEAQALLLYEPADAARLRAWTEQMDSESQKRVEQYKLNHMIAFAEASHCRRQILLGYFAERLEQPCQYCDICDNPPQTTDVTEDAQKLLSCIYRLKQSYGMLHVIEVLRGSEAEKIKQQGHDRLSTYGIGKDKPLAYWRHLCWQLIHREYCYQDVNRYQVLCLQPKAIALLKGEARLELSIQYREETSRKKGASSQQKVKPVQSPLFEHLKRLRRQLAEEAGKPPFMIFSDSSLYEMADRRPSNLVDFRSITGVGDQKLSLYGALFVKAIASFLQED